MSTRLTLLLKWNCLLCEMEETHFREHFLLRLALSLLSASKTLAFGCVYTENIQCYTALVRLFKQKYIYGKTCVFFSPIQDSRPTLISAIEDCVYTFLWLTAAACPLNSTQHDDCRVTNPATGQTFKINQQFCTPCIYTVHTQYILVCLIILLSGTIETGK